jgi:hypothetical protein
LYQLRDDPGLQSAVARFVRDAEVADVVGFVKAAREVESLVDRVATEQGKDFETALNAILSRGTQGTHDLPAVHEQQEPADQPEPEDESEHQGRHEHEDQDGDQPADEPEAEAEDEPEREHEPEDEDEHEPEPRQAGARRRGQARAWS